MPAELEVYGKQADLLASDAQYTLFCGGVGSGKTKGGAIWALREMLENDCLGFIGANTYQQLHQTTLLAFTTTIESLGIPAIFGKAPPDSWGKSPFKKHTNVLSVRTGKGMRQIICAQLGTYNFFRGLEIGWFWIDEARDTKRAAFDVLMGRLRAPGGKRRAIVTTTPDGFDWLYDAFVAKGEHALGDRTVIQATSRDNPWLPDGYVDMLLRNYSDRLAKQEVAGEFISVAAGQAYHAFLRSLHVRTDLTYNPALPLEHVWDFNVNPLCSNVIQDWGHVAVVLDEIHIEGSARTLDVVEEFIFRYRGHPGPVYVYGDASGNKRSTNAQSTDWQIVQREYQKAFPGRVQMRQNFWNPPVKDSVEDMNALLCNAAGEVRMLIGDECTYLIRDLEQVAWKPGTRDIAKDRDGMLTHHSDAVRYWVSKQHPARPSKAAGFTPIGA